MPPATAPSRLAARGKRVGADLFRLPAPNSNPWFRDGCDHRPESTVKIAGNALKKRDIVGESAVKFTTRFILVRASLSMSLKARLKAGRHDRPVSQRDRIDPAR
jgi:hypothetical protein